MEEYTLEWFSASCGLWAVGTEWVRIHSDHPSQVHWNQTSVNLI